MSSEQKVFRVNGVDINVLDKGEGDPTVIFLHYWGGSARTWSDTIEGLSKTNRCVALDFRGWGNSGKGPIDYGLDALASDVLGIIKQLALKEYIIVGHSMGGKVAQIVATKKPEGLKGLVLVAPAPPTPLPTPREVREHILGCLDAREGVESVLPMIANSIVGDPGAKHAWCDTGMDYDLTGQTSQVEVPIRVFVGGSDAIETEAALRTAFDKYYPGTDYIVITGVGHLIPLQAPAEVANAIREAVTGYQLL
jgi:pimeloyl-ACP methyl ester carboxylesterase